MLVAMYTQNAGRKVGGKNDRHDSTCIIGARPVMQLRIAFNVWASYDEGHQALAYAMRCCTIQNLEHGNLLEVARGQTTNADISPSLL